MPQSEERKTYNLTLEGVEQHLVSLTKSQADLIKWFKDRGYDLRLEELENNTPIII